MNCHYANNVGGFGNIGGRFKIAVAPLNTVNKPDKARKSSLARLLVFCGIFYQHIEICTALRAVFHCRSDRLTACFFVHFFNKPVARQSCAEHTKLVELFKKASTLSVSTVSRLDNAMIDRLFSLVYPHLSKLISGEAEHGRKQNCQKRHVLNGIVRRPHKTEHHTYFGRSEET